MKIHALANEMRQWFRDDGHDVSRFTDSDVIWFFTHSVCCQVPLLPKREVLHFIELAKDADDFLQMRNTFQRTHPEKSKCKCEHNNAPVN